MVRDIIDIACVELFDGEQSGGHLVCKLANLRFGKRKLLFFGIRGTGEPYCRKLSATFISVVLFARSESPNRRITSAASSFAFSHPS
jgi:hypothetical protein